MCSLPCKDKLHAFWDGVLGHDERPAKAIAAAALLPIAPSEGAGIIDVDAWVAESVEAAKTHVYMEPVGPDGHGPVTLDDTYRANAKAVAQKRIALAGARLAHLIRAALK